MSLAPCQLFRLHNLAWMVAREMPVPWDHPDPLAKIYKVGAVEAMSSERLEKWDHREIRATKEYKVSLV